MGLFDPSRQVRAGHFGIEKHSISSQGIRPDAEAAAGANPISAPRPTGPDASRHIETGYVAPTALRERRQLAEADNSALDGEDARGAPSEGDPTSASVSIASRQASANAPANCSDATRLSAMRGGTRAFGRADDVASAVARGLAARRP